jgi:transcriptional regulator with XRE-family HTH domain
MFGIRLKRYRVFKGWKGVDFTRITGISSGTLTGIEKNGNSPSAESLGKIARTTDLNIDWLLTGEGEMLKSICAETHDPYEARILSMLRGMDDDTKRRVEAGIQDAELLMKFRQREAV